ncbi:MAG: diguanylate cyclase [Venatoribacter sp.]
MFSLRQMFIALTLIYIALSAFSTLASRWVFFYPQEQALFLQQQQREVDNLYAALNQTRDILLAKTKHYRQHLEAAFASGGNLDISPIADKSATLDYLILTNANLDEQSATLWVSGTKEFKKPDSHHQQWLSEFKATHSQIDDGADLAMIGNQPVFIGFSRIKSPQETLGYLFFFIEINQQLLSHYATFGGYSVSQIAQSVQTSPAAKSFSQPLVNIAEHHTRCLNNQQGVAIVCFDILHTANQAPSLISKESVYGFIAILFIPVVLFAGMLYVFTEPLMRGTRMLQEHQRQGVLKRLDITAPIEITELVKLRDTFNSLVDSFNEQKNELEKLSNTDRLTNIANRRAFDMEMDKLWNRVSRHPHSAALVMVDIDYFKRYNDFYGHQAGDHALFDVAQALKQCAKRTDEMAARTGGEEFTLIIQIKDEAELAHFQERLSQAIAELKIPHQESSVSEFLTISAGIAWLRGSGQWLENYRIEHWLHTVDLALYRAKSSGRNRSEVQIIDAEHPFAEITESAKA